MKISIVTAYFNRKKLFYKTLLSLSNSAVKDVEVIVVDDGSSEDNRLEDLQQEFEFLKVIRLEPSDKWYINPCIPFNIGFAAAKGDIVIIQNPECLHYGDILKYVEENLCPNDYISFAAYSLDKETTDGLNADNILTLQSLNVLFLSHKVEYDGVAGWYNHSIYRPRGFHWCAAVFRTDLLDLGGFDQRFAMGVGFDDTELLERVKKKGMNVKIIDEPFVLHQNHFDYTTDQTQHINPFYNRENAQILWEKNEYLLNNHTIKRKSWKAKEESKFLIKLYDFLLSKKLKLKKNFRSLTMRIKNKLTRNFS